MAVLDQPVDILLGKDNSDDVELTRKALRRERLANRIEVARGGEEALDFLFSRNSFAHHTSEPPPRLDLLDLKLPKVDGLEVWKEIKNDPRTKTLPVVSFRTEVR